MKKLLIITFLLGTFNVFGQENAKTEANPSEEGSQVAKPKCKKRCCQTAKTNVISIDFKGKTVPNINGIQDIKKGDFYKVKVIGLNSSLYKVTIGTKDSSITKGLSMPGFSALGISDISALVSMIGGGAVSATKSVGSLDGMKSLMFADGGANQVNKDSLKEISDDAVSIANLLKANAVKVDKFYFDTQLALACALEATKSADCTPPLKPSEMIASITKARKEQTRIAIKLGELNVRLGNLSLHSSLKTQIDELAGNLKNLGKAKEKVDGALVSEKISPVISSVVLIPNAENGGNGFESLPQQFNGDYATINVKIEPRKAEYPLHSYSTSITFPNQRCWFGGVGTSFYMAGLNDEDYSVRETVQADSSSNFNLEKEDGLALEVGMAALLHFGWKLDPERRIGLNFVMGPGISLTEKVRPRLLLGAGIAIGKKHMFVLDGGVIMGSVNQLSTVYDSSTTYISKPEQVLVGTLKASGFGSVGYLFAF
jgi:hypothetical protein